MDARMYLTISSIIAILYAIGFLLIPGNVVLCSADRRSRTSRSTFNIAGRRCWRGA
jgi:hypothetical protein